MMRRAADWTIIEAELAGFYDRGQGRPSCPVQLLRIFILEQYATPPNSSAVRSPACPA